MTTRFSTSHFSVLSVFFSSFLAFFSSLSRFSSALWFSRLAMRQCVIWYRVTLILLPRTQAVKHVEGTNIDTRPSGSLGDGKAINFFNLNPFHIILECHLMKAFQFNFFFCVFWAERSLWFSFSSSFKFRCTLCNQIVLSHGIRETIWSWNDGVDCFVCIDRPLFRRGWANEWKKKRAATATAITLKWLTKYSTA